MEVVSRGGPPKFVGAEKAVTVRQRQILFAGVYLQLYNLVESTMTKCIEAVSHVAKMSGGWVPGDLTESMLKEWVRFKARTHVDLSAENRLKESLALCGHFISSLPVGDFSIEKGGGGNWDDIEIEAMVKRLGFTLRVTRSVQRDVKAHIRNDMGPLKVVKSFRNQLAHGSISFSECAEGVTVDGLVKLKNVTVNYLEAVIECFIKSLQNFEFLVPNKRPVGT
jgi:hypothetical protein